MGGRRGHEVRTLQDLIDEFNREKRLRPDLEPEDMTITSYDEEFGGSGMEVAFTTPQSKGLFKVAAKVANKPKEHRNPYGFTKDESPYYYL